MTKKRFVFSNDLHNSIYLRSFRKIILKVGTSLILSLILEAFNLDMLLDKRRRFNRIFQKDETNPQIWLVESIR